MDMQLYRGKKRGRPTPIVVHVGRFVMSVIGGTLIVITTGCAIVTLMLVVENMR